MPVTFMWICAADYHDTGKRYGSNVQLIKDAEGSHLKVLWCDNRTYIGRVLKKKHNRAMSPLVLDGVVNQLESAV